MTDEQAVSNTHANKIDVSRDLNFYNLPIRRTSTLDHKPSFYIKLFERLLYEVKQPVKDVSAVTSDSNVYFFADQPLVHLTDD